MKTIGLLGGMSWESTAAYYTLINQGIRKKLGGLHSARIILNSVDFEPIEQLQHQNDWEGCARILSHEARCIESAGADFLVICTNTMHRIAPDIEKAISIPLLHIADATAMELLKNDIRKVGLLGTAFTMEQRFYKGRLSEKYGLEVITPDQEDRRTIHTVIYNELCKGILKEKSRDQYLRIIDDLSLRGARAVILGCTEIAMLVKPSDTRIPIFDTTAIHASMAVEAALK